MGRYPVCRCDNANGARRNENAATKVNDWIRTAKKFDAVIDFDAAVRDPANPKKLKAEYDSNDHLHPSAEGARKMGEVVDLTLFN